MIRILVLGSGGREHAIVWRLAQDGAAELYALPGNPGTAQFATNVDLDLNDHKAILQFCRTSSIDLTIVGPEQPLVDGIVDLFRDAGEKIVGPTKAAAALEGSKSFAKSCMRKWQIPTADYQTFRRSERVQALDFLDQQGAPVVLKASGLAAGKGVLICSSLDEARSGLTQIWDDNAFGAAGDEVVIEEFLDGEEASAFFLCDGTEYLVLPSAQDHKRIGNNDTGLNTGGMGAYSPAPVVTDQVMNRVRSEIVEPLLSGMSNSGTPYTGFLFVGLMIKSGIPRVVEFNCRMGDPETQVVFPLIDGSLTDYLLEAVHGEMRTRAIAATGQAATCVVASSRGYPEAYETGKLITGATAPSSAAEPIIFQAGTRQLPSGDLVSSGGRVLGVTAVARTLSEATSGAYAALKDVHFDGMYYRTDIARRALQD